MTQTLTPQVDLPTVGYNQSHAQLPVISHAEAKYLRYLTETALELWSLTNQLAEAGQPYESINGAWKLIDAELEDRGFPLVYEDFQRKRAGQHFDSRAKWKLAQLDLREYPCG